MMPHCPPPSLSPTLQLWDPKATKKVPSSLVYTARCFATGVLYMVLHQVKTVCLFALYASIGSPPVVVESVSKSAKHCTSPNMLYKDIRV